MYEIPATLKKLTFTCDTINLKAFDTYSYPTQGYDQKYYHYHKTKNLEVIDTLILQNVKHITGGQLSKFFAQTEAVYITDKDAQELEPGLFAGLKNIYSKGADPAVAFDNTFEGIYQSAIATQNLPFKSPFATSERQVMSCSTQHFSGY